MNVMGHVKPSCFLLRYMGTAKPLIKARQSRNIIEERERMDCSIVKDVYIESRSSTTR